MRRAAIPPLVLVAWMAASGAWAAAPVVVELFTAQGCASCGKANAFVAGLSQRPGVIALNWSVDYWDYLGWKDTFAQPEFTDRQRAYDKRFDLRDVYTPQVIVDGAGQASGDKPADVESLIGAARHPHAPEPRITPRADGTISVDPPLRAMVTGRDWDVWLIRYDPREQDVLVKQGDNRGKTIVHRNVVRQLIRLGGWGGRRRAVYSVPAPPEAGLETLVLVQAAHGGRIIGLRRLAPVAS